MRVAIIGAGIAGLTTAKVLHQFGHEVTVFEKTADVGGVWSASRRYPGLTTQNPRTTYAFSDYPMPRDYPEWPSGQQIQKYLEGYAKHFGFAANIRLRTEVVHADLDEVAKRWTLRLRDLSVPAHALRVETFDYVVVCNGIFSEPALPNYDGAAQFAVGGGKLCHSSQFTKLEAARGKHVLVVGYGKSSCDVANAVAEVSASTTVVTRQLLWKVPKKFFNVLNFKMLLLTRMGEALFRYIQLRGFEKFLHGPGRPMRNSLLGGVQAAIIRQFRLSRLGLRPDAPFETIAQSTVSLVTDGFFEKVAAGTLSVKKGASIERLSAQDGARFATLSTGETLLADLVICGTGWQQRIAFFDDALSARITDSAGNFRLYRSILPLHVPCLAFNGYASSLFSQLNAEIGALWIAQLLKGRLALPSATQQLALVDERLRWMEQRTQGKHAKGTNIIPFSMHQIDDLLDDMGQKVGAFMRLREWLLPIDPSAYARFTKRLLAQR